jgi:hypothetical protein
MMTLLIYSEKIYLLDLNISVVLVIAVVVIVGVVVGVAMLIVIAVVVIVGVAVGVAVLLAMLTAEISTAVSITSPTSPTTIIIFFSLDHLCGDSFPFDCSVFPIIFVLVKKGLCSFLFGSQAFRFKTETDVQFVILKVIPQ